MKLVRFGNPGTEKPGLVDDQGRLRDLSDVIADVTPANLSRSALQKIAAIAPSTLPLVAGEPRFGVPAVCRGDRDCLAAPPMRRRRPCRRG